MDTVGSCPGFRRPKREADQSPPSKAEVKMEQINATTPHNLVLRVHKKIHLCHQTMRNFNVSHITSKAHIVITVNIYVFTQF